MVATLKSFNVSRCRYLTAADFGIPKRGNFGIPKWDFFLPADAPAFVGGNLAVGLGPFPAPFRRASLPLVGGWRTFMVTDKSQREPVGMRDTTARPAAANFYQPLIFELIDCIGHIFAGHAVRHELRMGHDKLAVFQGGVRRMLDDDAEEGAAGIRTQCREGGRFQQLNGESLPAKATVIRPSRRSGMLAHHRPRLSLTGSAFVARVEFRHQPLARVVDRYPPALRSLLRELRSCSA
ncbi:UNVERIFIED_ORG: hypothetical protein M2435_004611 [Rhizobium sophorae]|nr:hypothetical protein [Rhizobium leguminosarum]MBB4524615.1 hypothetical protein [Rhizobium leguminosarum]MDH6661690.1 hypothetical protein [Rhizobium sophorae]